MGSANERMRYIVAPSLIGWANTQNSRCTGFMIIVLKYWSILSIYFLQNMDQKKYD